MFIRLHVMCNKYFKYIYLPIIVKNTNIPGEIIERAITKVRLFEPNSLIREKADLFVKIHILPINQLISIEGNTIRPTEYLLDIALLNPSIVRINEYLSMYEKGRLSIGRIMDKITNKELLAINYIDLILKALREFNNTFICRHVLDHIVWAYDEIMNNEAVIKLFKDSLKDERTVDKALNELSKRAITSIIDFYNGLRRWVLKNELKKPTYTQYFFVNEILRRLKPNEYLIVVEANEDYFYVGLIKDVVLTNTIIKS